MKVKIAILLRSVKENKYMNIHLNEKTEKMKKKKKSHRAIKHLNFNCNINKNSVKKISKQIEIPSIFPIVIKNGTNEQYVRR